MKIHRPDMIVRIARYTVKTANRMYPDVIFSLPVTHILVDGLRGLLRRARKISP